MELRAIVHDLRLGLLALVLGEAHDQAFLELGVVGRVVDLEQGGQALVVVALPEPEGGLLANLRVGVLGGEVDEDRQDLGVLGLAQDEEGLFPELGLLVAADHFLEDGEGLLLVHLEQRVEGDELQLEIGIQGLPLPAERAGHDAGQGAWTLPGSLRLRPGCRRRRLRRHPPLHRTRRPRRLPRFRRRGCR